MAQIYLIRHAESLANTSRIYGSDLPLSDEGIKHAERKRDEIRKVFDPDMVITSTLTRAFQTGKILFPNKMYKVNPVFDEVDFGTLTNKPIDSNINKEIVKQPLLIHTKYRGDNIYERARDGIYLLQGFDKMWRDSTIAIVASATIMEAMCLLYRDDEIAGKLWGGSSPKNFFKNLDVLDWTAFSAKPKTDLKKLIF